MSAPSPAAVRTHQGGHPDHNEDAARAGDGWWVLADGMGGHAGGEVASAVAVDAAAAVLSRLGAERGGGADDVVHEAVAAAVRAVRERGAREPGLGAMGTTLVVAGVSADGELFVGNVGDSRAYVLVDERLEPLTRDDNLAQELLGLGLIDAQQAADHPGQYQLTKVVAAYGDEDPRPRVTRAPARGRLLLCSDGLTGELCDRTVAGLLATGDASAAADALLAAALRAPARDNVTVVVVDL